MAHDDTADGDEAPGRYAQRLDRDAAAVSEDASCVGQWHLDRLRAGSGPDITVAEARAALERHGVRVVELPGLPAEPPAHIAEHPEFSAYVAKLNRKLSIELVFANEEYRFCLLDGLRLHDGRLLDQSAIEQAMKRIPGSASQEEWQRVLSILADAALRPHAVDDIVVWEVVQALRALARLDYSQRAITEQAVRLSIERREAEVLAAAVAEEYARAKSPRQPADPAGLSDTRQPDPRPERANAPSPVEELAPPADLGDREPLQPVADLRSRVLPGRTDIVQLSWTPPPAGAVSLRIAAQPPPWRTGTALAAQDTQSYGKPLTADRVLGPDHRMSHELALPPTRAFVTAFTVRDADAMSGRTVEITREAPVRGLSQRRFGEQEVLLTWEWPDDAVAAYVAWQPLAADQDGPSEGRQRRRCTRRAYQAEGGFRADMGHAALHVEVWAVFAGNGQEDMTAPAGIEVPGTLTRVSYSFRRVPGSGGFGGFGGQRRRRELVLVGERPCNLPDLIVVECRHAAMPVITPHGDDVEALAIPGGHLEPGSPFRRMVELSSDGPCWLVCLIDPAQPAARRDLVTLVDPAERQLRVR